MAQSKCGSCGGTRFEMREASHVAGTELRWNFVQCADCGAVVGVVDFYSLSGILHHLQKIEKKLGIA